jgi:hypothetical protein
MSGEQTSINNNYHEEAGQTVSNTKSKKVDINIFVEQG